MTGEINNTSILCPASYEHAIKLISSMLNIDMNKVLEFKTIEEMKNKKTKYNKPKVKYPSTNITVIDIEDKEHSYMICRDGKTKRFDEFGINPKIFLVKVMKNFKDLGLEPTFVQNTRICEGGGWTSAGAIYECMGVYFYG